MCRNMHVSVLVILLLWVCPSTPDWTSECVQRYPASCRCTWSSGKRLADCQKANMNQIPSLSSDIQILELSNNKITQINDNAFTIANLINLQKLYLKGCRVTKLHALAFNNLRILIELDLSYNEIDTLDPNVFSTNERLRIIKLNNNKIHTIGEFPVLEHLNTIDFSYNKLQNFSFHTFTALRKLKVLDLSYNSFTNLNPTVFTELSSLGLRGNSWICDCELKPLREYVIINKFYETDIRCSEPLSLFNSQWDAFEALSCKPEIVSILANGKVVDSIVAMENTLVLSCVVKGDPVPDVKWVKNGRVVSEAVGSLDAVTETVILNLTVSKHDNEFVCVGSNSGGVVERNLTVTVDEAGLSGFVVFKETGGNGTSDDRNALIIYLIVAVVFISLIVGLVVGGVCVWRWGNRGNNAADENRDMVVKSAAVKNTNDDEETHEVTRPFEQVPLLEEDPIVRTRPTPDLLIGNDPVYEDNYDTNNAYETGKFPQDDSSVYDNYELSYKPVGPDALRRYAFMRNNGRSVSPALYGTVARPSSVCSEPRENRANGVRTPDTVIIPHGYVTLPRRSVHQQRKANGKGGIIKYDNLGPRTTADGSSNYELNTCGVDPNASSPQPRAQDPQYSNVVEMQDDQNPPEQPSVFDPIPELEESPPPPPQEDESTLKRKFRPVPPPKPKKKKPPEVEEPENKNDDDGTEV